MKLKSPFSKSYNPSEFEPEIYAAWEASGAFAPALHPASRPHDDRPETGAPETFYNEKGTTETFSIVMPPPNANGNLHIGHGLTVALEDSLTRYHRLRGIASWYIPGADHAGFETWVVYERYLESIHHTRFEYTRDQLYSQVWQFVEDQRGNMELQLRALGASCAWDDLTFTLDENVIELVYNTFEKMWNDGMIYRGEKLVNYCPHHQTAFADIEVEHKDEKGHLWEIAYPFVERDGEIIVSTTRPETLFGDTAIAVNPDDPRYKDIIGEKVKLPLTKREIPVIADTHADPEYGTGAVKITPAHDYDDFEVGERHDLPRIIVIGPDGHMTAATGPEYEGLSTLECRKKVLKDLKSAGLLKSEQKITHSVAHCYKCGTVIEPTLKEQWFIDVEKLATTAIEHLEKGEIKFHPANKQKVLINYLKGLKDWNISRQIPWGIAIPMFHNVNSGNFRDEDAPDWIFDKRTHLTEIEVGGVKYLRDEDTFDTWFSSSHWPVVCSNWLEGKPNPFYPLSVMETGGDILFAWVARMIMMGLYVTGEVPFKEVYLHGLVLDAHGQKMSKSKGNVLNPIDLVTKYGSDAFRLGILRGRSAGMNQAFSENSVVSGRNLCNKLWNISRLIQSYVDAEHESAEFTTDNTGEDWICRELDDCRLKLEKDLKSYRFSEAVETLYSTIWDKYADWFLETQKLYKNVPLLKKTLENLLIMLHPFAPFVTEAIWQNLSWTDGMIITAKWPAALPYDPISAADFDRLIAVVSEIRSVTADLPGNHRYGVFYGDDSIVEDNQLLIQHLTKAPAITPTEGTPRGMRLALANHELYLDVPEKIITAHRAQLEERILAVGRELDALNLRMANPNYVEKAPEHLVKDTKRSIAEKSALIDRLKRELELIK